MEIGKPERTIVIEPVESPVPEKVPMEVPKEPVPVKVPEREKVPA